MTITVAEAARKVEAIGTRFARTSQNLSTVAASFLAVADEAHALLFGELDGWDDHSPGAELTYRAALSLWCMCDLAAQAAKAEEEGRREEMIDLSYRAMQHGAVLRILRLSLFANHGSLFQEGAG